MNSVPQDPISKVANLLSKQQLKTCSPYEQETFPCVTYFLKKETLFHLKFVFLKLATFFISSARGILKKLSTVSESSVKIKVKSHWTLSVILITSVAICN